jgi:hypothetical protein
VMISIRPYIYNIYAECTPACIFVCTYNAHHIYARHRIYYKNIHARVSEEKTLI